MRAATRLASCQTCVPSRGRRVPPQQPRIALRGARCVEAQHSFRAATVCRAEEPGRQRGDAPDSGDGPESSARDGFIPDAEVPFPSARNGLDYYCYWVLGLLFLTDFTPAGGLVSSSGVVGSSTAQLATLAGVQWGLFVVPTLVSAWRKVQAEGRGFDGFRSTFGLRGCSAGSILLGLAAGLLTWILVYGAVDLRITAVNGLVGPPPDAVPRAVPAASADTIGAAAIALVTLSPAIAEELLFRGLLLTAIRTRLGSVDSVAVCALAFAVIHFDVQQIFQLTMLGFTCGFLTLSAESVLPAIVAHAAYNCAGLASAAIVASGAT
ncbi:unnamed protein product [Pedinophyceae sp. YPF-701]|nr:unnamed protein product [Pedinophyceae sp. YPF-701]